MRPSTSLRSITRRRILVVDDNADDARVLAMLFSSLGHRVEYALSVGVAVETARRFAPEFVFVDLNLPDGHGTEIARAILASTTTNVRIYAVTGSSDPAEHDRAMAAGCVSVLTKPVRPDILEQILKRG